MLKDIKKIVEVLRGGGVILYPTEGVYGLGCDPFNEAAVLRLLKAKKRNVNKGLILIVSSWKQVESLIKLDPAKQEIIKEKKLEPITWVFPATKKAPKWITGEFDSIAIRVIAHLAAKKICQEFGGPIVSTSANLIGKEAPRKLNEIEKEIIDSVDYVVSGETGGLDRPTEIYDVVTGKKIRGSLNSE